MTEPPAITSGEPAISFGPFRLVAAQRLLLEGDKPVRLGSRAFDILTTLVEHAGEVVGKEELIARAWPATYVEEANLKIQVSALRRALGDGQGDNRYVATITGRGYNFVAPIRLEEAVQAPPAPKVAAAVHNLPFAATRMIGREETAAMLVARLSRQRLVTIVGPGGIGKTTVALAVAERSIASYEHGVWLVDLAPLVDPRLVASAVATVLGLEVRTEDPLSGLVAALRDDQMLLLLDNCEHVIDATANLAAAVLKGTSGVRILTTSREPLRIAGERQYRLGPLGSPEPSSPACCAIKVAPSTPPPASSRSTIASRRVSTPPILSRRNSYWTRWTMPATTEPQASASSGAVIAFGPYRLVAARRLLLEGNKPVRLGSRAFDILTALVERAGEVVGKEELIARGWPATYVEEANLKIQVSALRRALGDGQGGNRYVATVVGRGYNFVAPIRKEVPSRALPSPTIAPAAPHNLPFATTRMIGREGITQLSHRRLVTVVGPVGIGKTTVGLAVAERMIGAYEHGVRLVDLAPLGDPGLVPSAVATVLGLEIRTKDPLPGLVAALRDSRVLLLLLLDNREHVIDAAAGLAAAVLSGASGVDILATSREPLGIQGERVHRLGPLGIPEPSPGLTAAEAAPYPAVQLLVERAAAIVEDFALTDANASLVAAICRRLDGLPLAIEFAAPRVEVRGIEGLAARLVHGIQRLSGPQRRTPVPRHRSMQAVVDWSYGLLSEDERRFFRALGIFAGGSTVEAAAAVAMDASTTGTDAIARLADLVAKSLVVADVSGARPRFRLLDTTRAYAIEKLDESGGRERIARRHAEYYRDLFECAEREVPARPPAEWLANYARKIDNLRAAVNWAFSPDGDESIGWCSPPPRFRSGGDYRYWRSAEVVRSRRLTRSHLHGPRIRTRR